MAQTTIKISARELLSYLAAGVDHKAFFAALGPDHEGSAAFALQLREGRLLEVVSVEHRPDNDDDWVVFRFGPPDPALVPLRPE